MVKSKTSPNIILAAIDSRATGETYPVVATVPWKEGVENDNLYIFQDTTKLNPTFLIGSNEQLDINPRSKSFTLEAVKIGVSTGEKTYADLNVTQEKATYEYTLEIKSKSGEITIPASGGSLELKGILTTWRNGRKVSTLETPFTMSGYAPGFSISGKTVTASNRGTVIGPSRAINIVGYTNNTIDGSTISGSVVITQEENKITKVAPSVTLSYNPSEIPAKGGTSSPVVGNISYITTFSSGETLNDLPTSEYINTITKTNTFKIHTSNSPFSIDESTGVVTIGTRGTILGEALEETIYLTHRVQISYKDNIFEPTSNSITRTADITQQANTVTYSDINISLFGAADIPASGGQVSSGTVSYSQVASYTSGEFENITTGATITYGDPVSANSKDITISNSTVAGTLEVTVSLNGKTATKTVDVYQEQNKVTQIELLDSWAHTYSTEGTAAQNSVGPDLMSRTYNVKYTFISGATSTDKPDTEFGTLSDTVNYSWPGPRGSFTGLSAQSGNVTMASLGTTIVNETTSPQVTRTDKVTWTPSSNYSYKTLESNEIQKQAQVTREGNYVVDIQLPEAVLSLSYNPSEIPAKGGSSSPTVTQSKEPSMIYTSGAQGEAGVIPASTYGSFYTDSNYELGTINSQYSTWKINAITGVLTVTSNKTSRVDRGSAESKYHKNFRWVPSSVYNGGGADITRHATATVYQQANTIESEEIIIDSFVYNTDIPVLGGNSSPSLSIHINQLYTSEEVKWVNPDSYTSKYAFVGTAPSTFSINANTGVVSATEAEVSQELKANVKVDISSPSWNGSSTLTKSAQADVAQPAGTVIYDTPVITISYPQVPAKGGTVSPTIQVTQAWGWNDDYDEGVNTFNLNSLPVGSYEFTGIATANGSVTVASKGTVVSGVTNVGTARFSVTLNGKFSTNSYVVTQQANSIDGVAVTFGWHNNTNSVAASGGSLVVDVVVKNTYTSTSTDIVYPSATDAGISLTVSGVSGATVSKATITVPNRGSTVGPALTGTVTGNYNGTNSGNSLTFTQAENRVTKLEAGVINPNTSTVHFWYIGQPIPASGGTATVVGNGKGVLTFSSGSVVTEATWSGQSKYGGTLSSGRTFSMTNGNGFTINTTNGSVTAANRGTTVGAVRTSNVITSELTLTFTYPASMGSTKVKGSIRGTQTVSQQANQITAYGNPTGGSLTVNDIPASGGTISSGTIGGTVSQTRTYTSGSNDTYSQATPTNGTYSAGISGSNLGTTITSRTSKGTLTYSYTLNGKSGSISATVYQQANTIESEEIIIDSFVYNTDIPVLGGNSSPSLSIHINQLYTSEEVKWVNPDSYTSKYAFVGTAPSTFSINANTGVVSATEAEVSQELKANVKVDISSPSWNGSSTLTKSAQADVAQPAGTVIYDTPVITISYPQVPAKGGTVSPTIQVTQAWGWNDDYDEGVNTFNLNSLPVGSYEFTGIATANGSVTVASKGTVVSGVTNVGTARFSVTLNGKFSTNSYVVTQQANSIDGVAVTFGWHNNTNSVAASGGSLVVDVVVKNTYTSTSTDIVYPSATDAGISLTVSGVSGATVSKATITVPNRGSTVGPALTGTVTGNYNGTNSGNSLTFTQAENRVTKLEAGVINPNTSTVHFWYIGQPIPASGGTATVVGNGKGVLTFSSGSVVTEATWSGQSKYGGTLSSGRTFSMTNGNGFTINTTNGSVTAANRGTTVGAVRTSNVITSELTLTFTYPASMGSTKVKGSIRGTQTVSQQANQITAYGNPTGGSLTVNDIPASGGTISSGTIGGTVSQTRTYTSGSNDTYSQATPTNGTYSAGISGSNLGTTITSRTSKGTLTYSYTLNGKSGSISATVYQQANTWKDNRMTLSASSTSIGAGGGTVTLHTVVYRMYTSGTEDLGGNDLVTSWSGSATGFTLSGFSLTAANRGTTVGNARSITLTATYAHLTSNSVTVTQAANSLTWNNPVITFSYPGDIPASGGTITPTVSITQSGSYSSGSPASNTTIASKSFSGTGVNTSTGAYTASSLGTTVKPRTNLVTATVTVTAQGKTASANAGIWQAENAKTEYKNITINQFFYSDIPYSGGTVSPNSDVEYDTTYTSGATLNNHGLPPGHTATYIWTGSKPSWGTLSSTTGNVTATSNSGLSSRSTSVSMEILYNGSAIGVSASTTVTQKSQGKVSVTLSISLNIYGSGSINASRAVNDSLNVGWTQHDDMGNGSDNFVNLSVGQSSASIMSMNSSWPSYSITQVNMQSSPPWVSGNWSYYW